MAVISARKTSVVTLALEEASDFIQENHRAGMPSSGKNKQCFGLIYENDLVAVAVFCNPRTSGKQRQYTTELLRLAFKGDTRVQGGASKLIKHFMKLPTSVDLFTYQDTSGEVTDVYQLSGMTPVGKANPTKTIVVRDGLTAESATNNRQDWFSMEQVVNRGPDALIGTTLGEVIEDGKRVSNLELFMRSGYHTEVVPGDRVYEWHNPAFRFYTYKITSTIDDGYYYGRHGTKLDTVDAMLNDGYMGSGGVKYRNWVISVGAASLRKEIVGVYSTWAESVKAEELLIGDSNLSDPHCKNSKPGGIGNNGFFPKHEQKTCLIHGETSHMGESCKKCSFGKVLSQGICSIHGESTFYGDNCHKCNISNTIALRPCLIHGETLHQGASCKKCAAQSSYSLKDCSIHGKTAFHGEGCLRCRAKDARSVRLCPIHGETGHLGAFCNKCLVNQSYSEKHCEVHGNSIHQGDSCKSCVANASVSLRNCPVHGETKHIGDKCRKCINDSALSLKLCPVHGETLHQSDACAACVSQKRVSVNTCQIHGEVKFLGDKCATCAAEKIVSLKLCPIHGESKHVGEHCKKCMAAKSWSVKECSIHGETKHNGDSCSKCKSAKIWTVEECSIHGESKHRSGKCQKCTAQKRKVAKAA